MRFLVLQPLERHMFSCLENMRAVVQKNGLQVIYPLHAQPIVIY